MIIVKMAFRNIFRRRRSVLTALMMTGGFALFSFSVGMADGMYGNIIDMFTRDHTGHVQVHAAGYLKRPSLYKTIDDVAGVERQIRTVKHVAGVTPGFTGRHWRLSAKKPTARKSSASTLKANRKPPASSPRSARAIFSAIPGPAISFSGRARPRCWQSARADRWRWTAASMKS